LNQIRKERTADFSYPVRVNGVRLVNTTFSHSVPVSAKGKPLLDYFLGRFPYHSRQEWLQRIQAGQVLLNGIAATAETRLRTGMRVQYRMENYAEPAVPVSFREILRQGDLALVHKPAGLPVHRTGRVLVNTLVNLYRIHCGEDSWSPLHRIDAETSGLVAFARGSKALSRYATERPETAWVKLYLAVVAGAPPEQGVMDIALAEKNDDPIHTRMHPDALGRPSQTKFRRLLAGKDRALLLLRPLTGRKHQIRAHCAASGFPIVGDKMYGQDGNFYLRRSGADFTDEDYLKLGATHHLLHAFHLKIRAEDGSGITGQDPLLPDAFLEYFPELSKILPRIPEGAEFLELDANEHQPLFGRPKILR